MYKIFFITFLFFIVNHSEGKDLCNAPSSRDGDFNVENLPDENLNKFLGLVGNLFSWKLDSSDQCLHSKVVYEALFSLDTHESIIWNNKINNTSGEISILLIRPRQGGYCKDYRVLLRKNEQYRTLRKRACIHYCSLSVDFFNLDNQGRCVRKNDTIGDPECGFTLGDMISNYTPINCIKKNSY